jgi:hypothetical protein
MKCRDDDHANRIAEMAADVMESLFMKSLPGLIDSIIREGYAGRYVRKDR